MQGSAHELLYKGSSASMPPSRPGWSNYAQALRELQAMGWRECMFACRSTELAQAVRAVLAKKGVCVEDATTTVPEGPDGDWSVWPFAGFDLAQRSRAHPGVAIVVLRTKRNTPAFLGGSLYGFCAQLGSMQKAVELVKRGASTPCGVLLYKGEQLSLPTALSQCAPVLAGRAVAAMLERDEAAFTCAVCKQSLLRVGGLREFVANGANGEQAVCLDCATEAPLRGPPRETQNRASVLNALANRVREAMVAEGLDAPKDAARFV